MFTGLPDYPWKSLKPFSEKSAQHQDGAIDLSVGSPIDPTPDSVQQALKKFSNSPGYPSTAGTAEFRKAVVEWFARRRQVTGLDPDQVMPSIGSKELISWLPTFLGIGPGDVVVQPKRTERRKYNPAPATARKIPKILAEFSPKLTIFISLLGA